MEVVFTLTKEQVQSFADMTGDQNSLHMNDDFARKSPYRKRVVHGMLPLLQLASLVPQKNKKDQLLSLSARFMKPAFIGDECRLELTDDLRFTLKRGEVVLTTGLLTLGALPLSAVGSGKGTCMTEPLKEAEENYSTINTGDAREVAFQVTPEVIKKQEGAPENLLAVTMLSTLVGMKMPGRFATFLDVDLVFKKSVGVGARYILSGKVKFKSDSTQSLVLSVGIRDGADQEVAEGKVSVKVNNPPMQMPSWNELVKKSESLGLKGKTALVTGASRGLGSVIAKTLAINGMSVAVNYSQDEASAKAVVQEIQKNGGKAMAVKADVSDRAQVRDMFKKAGDAFGGIDVLVNNAVRDANPANFSELSWEDVQSDIDVTVKGAFNCCQEVMAQMQKNGSGRIINISSAFVDDPVPGQFKYIVSKSALLGLTRSLAAELATAGILVNMVVPSLVETDLSQHAPKLFLEQMRQRSPMKRHADPSDVANAVLYLSSTLSSFTTGQRIMVTGGGVPFL